MKRYSDSIGGRWKRICPPADDSDSDSSQSSEGSSDDAHVTDRKFKSDFFDEFLFNLSSNIFIF